MAQVGLDMSDGVYVVVVLRKISLSVSIIIIYVYCGYLIQLQ